MSLIQWLFPARHTPPPSEWVIRMNQLFKEADVGVSPGDIIEESAPRLLREIIRLKRELALIKELPQ